MSMMKLIIENESVEDVMMLFALTASYRSLDRMYTDYKFEVVARRELLFTYKRLISEGKLMENEEGKTIKGPNWVAPDFVKTGKYDAIYEEYLREKSNK
ncbi:immunity protein [Xenorhabdus mauleonii]|uniref:Immunity protein n=1 Tax=Xenorhabdus mauleonii TaxID=351675 RepID=A0A1I3YDH8_9GAMM|nr:immunity protein [Xenorhabdus mauleonii]PHM35617.1 immunity protein [Xenorhabdus mauleonii]SFK29830.1 hypothetical protein SAMN05421680_15011 [Xenorhabdus mauleonii]